MSPEAIWAFLDLEEGGEKRVEMYEDSILTEYFGEYSPTAVSFGVTNSRSMAFKEYASFCIQWMLLQQSLYVVTTVRGNIIIAGCWPSITENKTIGNSDMRKNGELRLRSEPTHVHRDWVI
jgi:hypothetical protein